MIALVPLTAPTDLSAHGIGGQQDLPIPLGGAIAGGVAALLLSFLVLALAWRRPRYATDVVPEDPTPEAAVGSGLALVWPAPAGTPVPVRVLAALGAAVRSRGGRAALRVFGLLVLTLAGVAAIFGRDLTINPLFGIFYVWLWVGIVPASLFFGPFYRAISPVRAINAGLARLAGTDPDEGLYRYPARLGYWPAALGLFAFVWMELVYPHMAELGPVRTWCAIYLAVMVVGGAVFGNTFFAHCDPFEVYSSLVARLSPWRVDDDGVLRLVSPLAHLATIPAVPGLVAVVAVLFGSTGYDSFGESPTFVDFVRGQTISPYTLENLALLTFCLGAGLLFAGACALTGVRAGVPRRALPGLFAFSVVPIIVGYIVAHYLTYFLELGSRTVAQAADPLSRGDDLLGLSGFPEIVWLSYHPTLLATIKVLAVVLGHVVAAVAAHDRALRVLPPRHHLTGQLPLLAVMVFFTGGGLYLLFSS
ncbi:hypothetical protein [Nocardioides sp.]|uniref:hypothetical protein n=1 Tax=Nocardioides sp. TaxID=35761 RepID=UPI0035147851